jgi:hypothetical protein
MAITSVSAATSGLPQQQVASRQPQESQEARPAPAAARPPEQPQRAERSEPAERPERNEEARSVEAPKPVVNAQGQKTGSIINTTA